MRYSKINIIGAGCIGHLLAFKFSKKVQDPKIEVNLYTRRLKKKRHLQYQSPTDYFELTVQYSVLDNWKQPDLIIICVKYPQLEKLCQRLTNLSSNNKIMQYIPILILMNGMGILEIVMSYLPNNPIYQAVTTHGAKFQQNTLLHTGFGETQIGSLQVGRNEEHKNALCGLLNLYLPKTFLDNNIEQALWKKLLINAVINPLTTIHDIENGKIIGNSAIKQECSLLCLELSPMLNHLNVFDDSQHLFEQVCFVAQQTKNNISSMRQDHLNHRKSEIDSITGYLLKQAKRLNIDLPLHNKIYRKIKRLENHF